MKKLNNVSLLRKITVSITAIITLALSLAGTYAWMDLDQHKTAEFALDGILYSVTLNSDFCEITNWNAAAPEVNKDITVTNTGFNDGTYGDVYVRLQLREYFEIRPMEYVYTPDRYMVARPSDNDPATSDFVDEINTILTSKGAPLDELAQFGPNSYENFITFKTAAAGEAFLQALQSDSRWADTVGNMAGRVDGPIEALNDMRRGTDGKPEKDGSGKVIPIGRYYIKTAAKDPNGQYGKYLATGVQDGGTANPVTIRDGITPPRADQYAQGRHNDGTQNCVEWQNAAGQACQVGQTDHQNAECEYLLHLWDARHIHNCDLASHRYTQWNLGFGAVITADEWRASYNSAPVDKWIVDTDSKGGWVYWGRALAPEETTSKLLDSIQLTEQPDGRAYYAIHADMEAADLASLDQWVSAVQEDSRAPQDLIEGITGGANAQVSISPATAVVAKGNTVTFNAVVSGATNHTVVWTVEGGNGSSVIHNGELTVGAAEAEGTLLTVTATTETGGKVAKAAVTVAA